MNMRIAQLNGANSNSFDRMPEKLVLEGYRRWTAGFETGSIIPWEMTWSLYSDILGSDAGNRLVTELSHFVRILRHCAGRPLHAFPFDSHHLCTEECITLGLIAALQNEDESAACACLEAILCNNENEELVFAARHFADTLAELGQNLLPIPMSALEAVLGHSSQTTFH